MSTQTWDAATYARLWMTYVVLRIRFGLLTEALIVLTTVVLYVLACEPLTPCAGTVRDWLERNGDGAERPAPAPTRVTRVFASNRQFTG